MRTIFNSIDGIDIPAVPTKLQDETIGLILKADSSGNIYIPLSGFDTSGGRASSYNWKITVGFDRVVKGTYSGTGASGTYLTLTGFTANSFNYIEIIPNTNTQILWARAFGYKGVPTNVAEQLYYVCYEPIYGFFQTTTNAGNHCKREIYRNCTNLIHIPTKIYGNTQTVKTIGTYYCYYEFAGCTSLVNAQQTFVRGATSIGNNCCRCQYVSCSTLEVYYGETLPGTDATIGDYFFQQQFYGCHALRRFTNQNKEFGTSNSKRLTSIGINFRAQQFYNCSSLTSPLAECAMPMSGNGSCIGDDFRSAQYRGCSSLTGTYTEKFCCNNNYAGIPAGYRGAQLRGTRITTLIEAKSWNLRNNIAVGDNYRYRQCYNGVVSSAQIENMTTTTSIGANYRGEQFKKTVASSNYFTLTIVATLSTYQLMQVEPITASTLGLTNNAIINVIRPNWAMAYLARQDTTYWTDVTDSKLIGPDWEPEDSSICQLYLDLTQNVADHSGNARLISNLGDGVNIVDGAGYFNGNAYLTTPNSLNWLNNTDFTVAFKIKKSSINGDNNWGIISQKNSTGREIYENDYGTQFMINGESVSSGRLNNNTWYSVCWVYNSSSGQVQLYIDDNLVATSNLSITFAEYDNKMIIGARSGYNNKLYQCYLKHLVIETRKWDYGAVLNYVNGI